MIDLESLTMELEMMDPVYQVLRTAKYQMPEYIIKGFGSSEWYSLLHEIVGRFVTVKRGSRIDTLYQELSGNYPYLLDPEIINQEDQLLELIEFERKYRSLKLELKGITNYEDEDQEMVTEEITQGCYYSESD